MVSMELPPDDLSSSDTDEHTSEPQITGASTGLDGDEVRLLTGQRIPFVRVDSEPKQISLVRSEHSLDDWQARMPLPRNSTQGQNTTQLSPSARVRPTLQLRSTSPSRARELLGRLKSLRLPRSPIARRGCGGQYDTLDEPEGDHFPVDISSLAGLGYELKNMPHSYPQSFSGEDTTYGGAAKEVSEGDSPAVRTESRSGLGIGGGMIIGMKLDPSADPIKRAKSARVSPLERTKTVRALGQNLAQEKQMIIAVSETVDLGTLEGDLEGTGIEGIQHRASTHSFQMLAPDQQRRTTSYFYPEDPDVPNWRPFSMSRTYILFLIFVSIGLAGIQEWQCQHSMALVRDGGGILSFNRVSEVSVWQFFAWKYLPTMITIIYAVLFSIMDFDIRRLEPYYQLSRPHGSTASASLNLDHLTMFQYFVPFKAAQYKQWAVFFSTIGNILASTVTPAIQNPSINFVDNPNCHKTCPIGQHKYLVVVVPAWSRALEASLLVTALIGVVLLVQLRRKSGLLSDPKGIAGIASMATKSHILNDFQGTDLYTRGQIHRRLEHRQFVLYKSSIWQGAWNSAEEHQHDTESRLRSPHPLMLRVKAGIPFVSGMILCLISIPVINFTSARVIPNAVPWLPVLVATLIKMFWTTLESDVRLMEPFYRLSKGNARPEESLTLDYQGTVYGWMPIKALLNGHLLLALVGFSSVALDVLTVTVSSFSVNTNMFLHGDRAGSDPSSQDETFVSFWTSVILSIVILTVVIGCAALVYLRRHHPFLPREPSTIAAVLAFIYASNMLDDFIDTETLTNKEMELRLKSKGKRYALGWFRGRDGKIHCAIDQEPIRSVYVHGKPYTNAQAPWEQSCDHEFV